MLAAFSSKKDKWQNLAPGRQEIIRKGGDIFLHLKCRFSEIAKNVNGRDDDVFLLYFYYNSFLVKEEIETLVYDLVGVLAAAGGYLGLCLGFSCLTLFMSLLDWMEIKLRKWKQF